MVTFTGKHLCWSLFLIKMQTFRPATLSKRDSITGVFLWILQNLKEQLFFSRTSPVAAFVDYLQHCLTHFKPLVCLMACGFLMFLEDVVVCSMKWVVADSVRMLYSLPSRHLLVQSQKQKHQSDVWKLTVNTTDRRHWGFCLICLLLTLNRFHTLFSFFCRWLWTSECRLGNHFISIFPLNSILKSVEFVK